MANAHELARGHKRLRALIEFAVGDQLDVVEAQKPPVRAPDRAVAGAVHVDDMRVEAKGLPDDPAPARLERAADVVFLVGGRRRGQPERVRGADADEIRGEVGHVSLPGVALGAAGRWGASPPSPRATPPGVFRQR